MKRRFKVGLALGGGAARGLAHLGVLRVLERENVPIDMIAGSSMGALAGALYAANPKIEKIILRAATFFTSPEFVDSKLHYLKRGEEEIGFFESVSNAVKRGLMISSAVTRLSFLEREDLYELLGHFVDDRDIRSLQIPLAIVACDLARGAEVVFRKGPIIDAIAASSAVPGAFPPVRIGGMDCIDGGVVNMVPVSAIRDMGADLVIAVNVSHDLPQPAEMKRALEVFFHTHEITKQVLINLQIADADIVLTPSVGHIHWADFTAAERIIQIGEDVAQQAMPQIRQALVKLTRRQVWPRFYRRAFGKIKI